MGPLVVRLAAGGVRRGAQTQEPRADGGPNLVNRDAPSELIIDHFRKRLLHQPTR
jgi:hypothetical protein